MNDQNYTVVYANSLGRIYYLKECHGNPEINRAYNKVLAHQEQNAFNTLVAVIATNALNGQQRYINGIEFSAYDYDSVLIQKRRSVRSYLDESLHNRFATLFNLPQCFQVPIHINAISPQKAERI